ncbi:M48 family metallopeptidase [Schlegelella sp. S2-27]|uniref:M48 family metallopeptidase n=1 Tax=Caldimonas mangrovi TaxID=2944811 RepID=A0ABT0YKA1_9BURK|nr:M48 family metallopeptidase [Caldimonas mangrovi]
MNASDRSAPTLALDYFDGRRARALRVQACIGDGMLHLRGDGVERSVPLRDVQWPERTRHGKRIAHLDDGASLHAPDAAAWDAWVQAAGQHDGLVSQVQQSWRWVFASVVLLLGLVALGYQWGLPWAARGVVSFVPHVVDETIGASAYASIGSHLLQPSALPQADQQRYRQAFQQAVQRAYPDGGAPDWQLHFHQSRIGPNAFALPGGTMVMTDELVKLVDGDADAIVGVLAHELGHVERRHGMRALVQATLLGAVASVAFGDFSGWLATAPVVLGQAAYSRHAEREADRDAIRLMKAAGISPLAMVRFFDKMAEKTGDREPSALGIAFASHPPDAERVAMFREAAATP